MSDSQKSNITLGEILSITIVVWLLLLPIVNGIELPFRGNDSGIISPVTMEEISPYTDYLKFAILLFAPAAIAFLLALIPPQIRLTLLKWLVKILSHRIFISTLTLALIFIWSIDRIFPDFGMPLVDAFHEGEYLGYLPNFMQLEKPFLKSVFIHGFGLDVIPVLLAHWWVEAVDTVNNEIAMTRFFYAYISLLAILAYFWLLWETIGIFKLKNRNIIFLFITIICCMFELFFFYIDGGRSLFFMVHFALTLRCFNFLVNNKNLIYKKQIYFAWKLFLLGLLIPLSFLHTYDRALYFILIYIFTCAISLTLEKRIYLTWFVSSISGAIVSTFLLLFILGFDQFSEILSQISFWSKYGRYMFYLPMPRLQVDLVKQLFWLPIFFQSMTCVYLILDLLKVRNLQVWIRENFYLLIILFSCLVYMRIGLDRSQIFMAAQSGFLTFVLVVYLSLTIYKKYVFSIVDRSLKSSTSKIFLAAIALTLMSTEAGFALSNLSDRFENLDRSNAEILQPQHLEVLEAFQADIDRQSCFYTATGEGIWYYLFDKPSCSKFVNIYYALPTVAQEETIDELEETQPERVLLTDTRTITGRTIADSTPLILQYFLDRYRPERLVAERWLWRRSQTPIEFLRTETSRGTINDSCVIEAERECQPIPAPGERLQLQRGPTFYSLEGSVLQPDPDRSIPAVYLSYGSSDRLVNFSRVRPDNAWSLEIPAMAFPIGTEIVRMWAYDAVGDTLEQIGGDIAIEITEKSG
ncbi:MAG: hypothetical protein SWY16_19270 [Cyanobacteriota bacterium]|nr:hypothetical protein [Cyanobacteriota bacterium]